MSKLLRVRQIDATILDEEILKAVKIIVENSTKYLTPGLTVPFEPEIDLILNLFILTNSIWKSDSTFGQQLLLIKYDNLTDFKKILYIILSSSNYFKERLALWKPSHSLNRIFDLVEGLSKILSFINLCIFLRNGQMPKLIDRILGLSQVYTVKIATRQQTNKYLTRELLWNGLIELFVFIIPLINYHKVKRFIRDVNPFVSKVKSTISKATDRRPFTLRTKCPHCNENPVKPFHMGCAHIFCYVCLKSNLMADELYACPSCGHCGQKCERVCM